MIFAVQLQEKCQEQHRHLFTAFVDLTKAFDTFAARDSGIMDKYGITEKYRAIVKPFHCGMLVRVMA